MKTIELLPDSLCPPLPDAVGPGLLKGESRDVVFPLAGLSMEARLIGPLANVDVRQQFSNPYSDTIEAVYIFPLPAGAAVYRFRMQVKDRIVDGVVQERAQARATYEEGVRQGHRSALMEMERDNVFTVHLGNLPPGETIAIELSYAHRMELSDAEQVFRFPLVVAPRYIPGDPLARPPVGSGVESDTTRVPDASRLTPPRLVPGLHTGANLSLKVSIETGGFSAARLACSQHVVEQTLGTNELQVELAHQDELLDRDFILRYRLADAGARSLLLASPEHFLLQVLPPLDAPRNTLALDVVFVLDRSGSMRGVKMDSARRAVADFLGRLRSTDRFAVLAFDDRVEAFSPSLAPQPRVADAVRWLDRIDSRGGTEIREALRDAIDRTQKSANLPCIVIITDGQVGNEPEIYRTVQQQAPRARIFTLGIDTAVNDAFLRRLAGLGRGTCELVTPGENLTRAVDRLSREISTPVITDLKLHDEGFGIDVSSLAPTQLPDVFAARPAVVAGRHQGSGALRVTGEPNWSETLHATPTSNPALPVVWAREQITALEDRLRIETVDKSAVEKDILELALRHQLLTRFTAFVLVDKAEVVADGRTPRTVVQPVETPAEWASGGSQGFAGAPQAAAPAAFMGLRAAASPTRSRTSDTLAGPPPPPAPAASPAPPRPAFVADPLAALRKTVETFSTLWQAAKDDNSRYTPAIKASMAEVLKALAIIGTAQTIHLMEAGAKLNTALQLDRVEVASLGAWLDELRRLTGLPPLDWWSDNI